MKTRNLIFAILWALLAILMIVCAVIQWMRVEYWTVVIAAMAFGCNSYSAWTQFGYWLEARKALKQTKTEIFAEYDNELKNTAGMLSSGSFIDD